MTAQAAVMDREDVRGAFSRSVFLHVVLFGGLAVNAWLNGPEDPFGDPNAGGAAVGIEAVTSIPLPSRGPENPVANDTESEVPQEEPEKPAPKQAPEPEPEDAVALLPPKKTSKQPLTPKQRLKTFDQIAENQLRSKTPQAASSPLFSQAGAGQVGVSGDTTLGSRFPAYAAQIRELTRMNWRTQDVDASVKESPPVVVHFELLKDGRASGVRLVQRSGVASLDLSVINAVETAHYPPLPDGYDRDSVPVEFRMVLKR